MTSHVYILAHKTEHRLKIGKADDVIKRAAAFGLDGIDLERSIGLRVSTVAEANNVERLLHRAFAAWRLPDGQVTGDGATEWFRADCMERLRAFLESNRDLLGIVEVPVAQARRERHPRQPGSAPKPNLPQKRFDDDLTMQFSSASVVPLDLDLWLSIISNAKPLNDFCVQLECSVDRLMEIARISVGHGDHLWIKASIERLAAVRLYSFQGRSPAYINTMLTRVEPADAAGQWSFTVGIDTIGLLQPRIATARAVLTAGGTKF